LAREPVYRTNLPLPLFSRGKVRDTYDLGDRLLMVTTDRLSAFDVVFPDPIPYKGIVLNELSLYWFRKTKGIVRNHLLTTRLPPSLSKYAPILNRRFMIVRKAKPIPIECVVRGYLSGSAWREYVEGGSVCGIRLPPGLPESSKLPEPIFTPATKAAAGHDINIPFAEASRIVGKGTASRLRDLSIRLYKFAAAHALKRGIIISDTKFEFGFLGKKLILIDELLTPDSSRFWPADSYKPGGPQPSFDKQFVRDYVLGIGWDKSPPAPRLPRNIIEGTTNRYIEAFERLTGRKFRRD